MGARPARPNLPDGCPGGKPDSGNALDFRQDENENGTGRSPVPSPCLKGASPGLRGGGSGPQQAVFAQRDEEGHGVALYLGGIGLREGFSQPEGVYLAKVQNDNADPIYISEVSLILQDKDGNEVGKGEFLSNSGSRYLEPGEATFLCITADVNDGAEVADHATNLTCSPITYQTADLSMEVSDAQLRVEEGYSTNYYTAATVTNTTDAPLSRLNVVSAVRSADGKLLDLTTSGLYQNELAAGSTITLVDSLDSRAVTYCTENNLTPDQVEAFAWVETY